VYPSRVEEALLSHGNINEAVVFGLNDMGDKTTLVCAWVKLKSCDRETSVAEIQEHCRKACLSDYQIPKRIRFVQEYPMKNGKYKREDIIKTENCFN
jgi:acyl-coenzyme A synthetase/AMP-(fatty) acid ligase